MRLDITRNNGPATSRRTSSETARSNVCRGSAELWQVAVDLHHDTADRRPHDASSTHN